MMENLKIRVTTAQESKEAQELFFELGFGWHAKGKVVSYSDKILSDYFGWLVLWKPSYLTNTVIQMGSGFEDCKEITLPQLKDMVVLKRNDPGDANYSISIASDRADMPVYKTSDAIYYTYSDNNDKWVFCNSIKHNTTGLKPIKKEQTVKEYLDKDYKLVEIETYPHQEIPDGWIEIPQGAEILTIIFNDKVFYKSGNPFKWFDMNTEEWRECSSAVDWDGFENKLWQRESLNDKVASAEVARQEEKTALDELLELRSSDEEIKNRSAWDKQVGGLHYKDFAIQPMQFALANQLDYAQSNVIKYVTRHAQKNGKQDLLKAIHNIELMIEYYYPE